jgi:signal transduction histidine kinase
VSAGALAVLGAAWRAGEKPRILGSSFAFQIEEGIAKSAARYLPFFVVDLDLDGHDDLLVNEANRFLWYRLHGMELDLAGEYSFGRRRCANIVADANGDGRPEFFVYSNTPEGWVLSCHDWFSPKGPSAPLYTIGPLTPLNWIERPWMMTRFASSAADKNTAARLFIGINTRKADARPCFLGAFDGPTGRELWRFEFGPHIEHVICADFGASGPRVIATTYAARTGISAHEMASDVTYVFCLDPRDGRELWRKELAGLGGRGFLSLADIDADGKNEILVARYLPAGGPLRLEIPPAWTVMALSADGEALSTVSLDFYAESLRAVELDGDPFPEFLVQGIDGELAMLEHDFRSVKIADAFNRKEPVYARLFGAGDLNDDGKPEIVCRLDSLLIVMNPKGAPLAKRTFPRTFEAQIARYDGMNRIVVATEDSIRIMTLAPSPLATRLRASARRSSVAAYSAALFIVGSMGLAVRTHVSRRGAQRIAVAEARNDLLTAMSAFGHGGSSLKVLDRLRLHLKNWDQVQSDTGARAELFERLRETFVETVVPEMEHIVMLARKAGFPEETWRTVVEKAGLAGQDMASILASGAEQPAADPRERVSSALSALEDVDRAVAGIRANLRSIFRTPLAEALERGAARCRDERAGKTISLSLPPGVTAAESVFVSPLIFDKIVETLLSNSARATDGNAAAEIAIDARWEGNYCTIDIRDNGCGIPREDWEQAFERYYTTKEEGGFGLHYARTELARFGGKIFVLDSVVGSGTTMRIVLRKT